MECIDKLIYTLEILRSALSAREKNKALEAITLLVQQFTVTFEHATHVFLAILFLETLKVHILFEEFEEASGGALALLARLTAVNATLKQSAAQSAPTNFDASVEDVLGDVMNAGTTPVFPLPLTRGEERETGAAFTGRPKPASGNLFANHLHNKLVAPRLEPRLPACVGSFSSDRLTTKRGRGGEASGAFPKPDAEPPEPSTETPFAVYPLMKLGEPSNQRRGRIFVGGFPHSPFKK